MPQFFQFIRSILAFAYMQYSFPPNLIYFLNTFTKRLQTILDYFRIDEILGYLDGGSLPYQSKKQIRIILSTKQVLFAECQELLLLYHCFIKHIFNKQDTHIFQN
ncbi:unnamed protein product [Paramecium octaurelia]|uniref:Uncharacterized protein n=1 Tax=Paramecium octaurelia TaxID=43137 RepID=A0A8S1YK58_PAROT|nr:unnamed protein product [Paramecium octaurelia]